jgi:hypothetical protein
MWRIWSLFLAQVVPRRGKGKVVICWPRIRCFSGFVCYIFASTNIWDNCCCYV